MRTLFTYFLLISWTHSLFCGETASFHDQEQLSILRKEIKEMYNQAGDLVVHEAHLEDYQNLLERINERKGLLIQREQEWKERYSHIHAPKKEEFALFDQEETTIGQLISEYGSKDFLYVVPSEVGQIKISMQSTIAIPRESWGEMIDLILQYNGVGVIEINPFARQLFLLKHDLVTCNKITTKKEQLALVPSSSRVMHIFEAPVENIKNTFFFFDRFRDPKRTFAYQIGAKIALVGTKEDIVRLIEMYDGAYDDGSERITRVLSLQKLTPDEMRNILKAYFGGLSENNTMMGKNPTELSVLPLNQESGIVLVGPKKLVERAMEIVKETEGQLVDPSEMTVYWYICRHSDPNDIADILEQVYASLMRFGLEQTDKKEMKDQQASQEVLLNGLVPHPYNTVDQPTRGVVNPPKAETPSPQGAKKSVVLKNFIPYGKAGGIMMVVRKDTLDRLKDLLKMLDVPKKMVHLEVILCEKRVNSQTNSGLNLLRIGSNALNQAVGGFDFLNQPNQPSRGITEFFFSRPKSSAFPAFDLTYNFLMNQEDIRIHNSPTVTTVNQTPATIAIVEEISINNGAAAVNNTGGSVSYQDSYSRAQYGVTIVMTPTVHDPEPDDDEHRNYITIDADVTFDTFKSDIAYKPDVNRRHVINQVRVLDGETIIMGGLKRKDAQDKSEKIPFLGEIPGLGKVFGSSQMNDQLTDMYVFITPRVIKNTRADLEAVRQEELCRRPGDLPPFLECRKDARNRQKKKLFEQSLKLLTGNTYDYNDPSSSR
ncbi:MAG: type II secretion system protein GspD [Chlamydiia bacterium]